MPDDAPHGALGEGRPLAGEQDPQRAGAHERVSPAQGDDRPHMMPALLIYCHANGMFSSRRIERATCRDIGVRFIAANRHPDHDTICAFRRRNHGAGGESFLHVLLPARELKLLRVGQASVDGTKMKANASRRRSVRYDHAQELRVQRPCMLHDRLGKPPSPTDC